MPKVKLIQLFGDYKDIAPLDSYYTNDVFFPLFTNNTNWEEISDEDLVLLERWVSSKNYSKRVKYLIVLESDNKIVTCIAEELKKFKKEQAQYEKTRKENEAKEKIRKEKAAKRKLEKARKVLEEAGEL